MLLAAHFQVLVEVASGMLEKIYLALYAIHLTNFFFNTEHDLHNRCHIVSSRWDLNFRSMYHIENVYHSQIVSSTRRASSNSFKSKFNPNQMVPLSQVVRKCSNFAVEIHSDIAEIVRKCEIYSDIAGIQLRLLHSFWKDFHTHCNAIGLQGTSWYHENQYLSRCYRKNNGKKVSKVESSCLSTNKIRHVQLPHASD